MTNRPAVLHCVLMGEPHEPERAVLIAGLLAGGREWLDLARRELAEVLGPVELVSDVWPFTSTPYYEDELGPAVLRQFVAFAEPFALERLAEVKLTTNALESRLTHRRPDRPAARPVNIDPGYVTLASLVLATTKNRPHRIYLGRGIFAEVTLHFEKGAWRPWPWTYPDYAAPTYYAFFTQVRARLKERRAV